MTADRLALLEARRRLPVGRSVRGTVSRVPRPGTTGLFIELDDEPTEGFIDVGLLPHDVALWPCLGWTSDFEVLQHRLSQVRLWPLDPQWRSDTSYLMSDEAWARARSRHRSGEVVVARTTDVFAGNQECAVEFDDLRAVVEWSGEPPAEGSVSSFRIAALLDTTHRILLTPTKYASNT